MLNNLEYSDKVKELSEVNAQLTALKAKKSELEAWFLTAGNEALKDSKAYISEAQIKKIFGLAYELAALSPSDAKVKDRLCGIIFKELGLKVNPCTDIFKGFSERQGQR